MKIYTYINSHQLARRNGKINTHTHTKTNDNKGFNNIMRVKIENTPTQTKGNTDSCVVSL